MRHDLTACGSLSASAFFLIRSAKWLSGQTALPCTLGGNLIGRGCVGKPGMMPARATLCRSVCGSISPQHLAVYKHVVAYLSTVSVSSMLSLSAGVGL